MHWKHLYIQLFPIKQSTTKIKDSTILIGNSLKDSLQDINGNKKTLRLKTIMLIRLMKAKHKPISIDKVNGPSQHQCNAKISHCQLFYKRSYKRRIRDDNFLSLAELPCTCLSNQLLQAITSVVSPLWPNKFQINMEHLS